MKYQVYFPMLDGTPEEGPVVELIPDRSIVLAVFPNEQDPDFTHVRHEIDGRISLRSSPVGEIAYMYPIR